MDEIVAKKIKKEDSWNSEGRIHTIHTKTTEIEFKKFGREIKKNN